MSFKDVITKVFQVLKNLISHFTSPRRNSFVIVEGDERIRLAFNKHGVNVFEVKGDNNTFIYVGFVSNSDITKLVRAKNAQERRFK